MQEFLLYIYIYIYTHTHTHTRINSTQLVQEEHKPLSVHNYFSAATIKKKRIKISSILITIMK